MTNSHRMSVKFWGVRGSTATPHPDYLEYGGNTTCIEVLGPSGERLIFDAGTGIRNLGLELAKEGSQKIHLFLTHFHWDHIQGLPFFAPLLTPGNTIHFHSFPEAAAIRTHLERQMVEPYFTLAYNSAAASREYSQVDSCFQMGELSVTSFPLNHPQGAFGYRIESKGASVVIATDCEHGNAELDGILRKHSEGADVLIYDSQYTTEEYAQRQGWGHSHYQAAASAARDAGVSHLVLFHHDPAHDDSKVTKIVERASALFESVSAASELHTLVL